jgi:hypothetical protein
LERTGLTRSEFLQEPQQAANLAKFHAANIVTGSDATQEGKSLVVELMSDRTYRETFSKEVERYFDTLPDHHKAEAQKFVGVAFDLVAKGERENKLQVIDPPSLDKEVVETSSYQEVEDREID